MFNRFWILFPILLGIPESCQATTATCLYIEPDESRDTSIPTNTNDSCILSSTLILSQDSPLFNRSYITTHCQQRCNGRSAAALVSFPDDEVAGYLSCSDGPVRSCQYPYLFFSLFSSQIMLYEPIQHVMEFISGYWTNSNTLGSYNMCAYSLNATYLFDPYDVNCSLSLPFLCECF